MKKVIEFDIEEIKSREIKPESYLSILIDSKNALVNAKGNKEEINEISKALENMLDAMDDERFMYINSILSLHTKLLDSINIGWLDRVEKIFLENQKLVANLSHTNLMKSKEISDYITSGEFDM